MSSIVEHKKDCTIHTRFYEGIDECCSYCNKYDFNFKQLSKGKFFSTSTVISLSGIRLTYRKSNVAHSVIGWVPEEAQFIFPLSSGNFCANGLKIDRYRQVGSTGNRKIHTIYPEDFGYLFLGIPFEVLSRHLGAEEYNAFISGLNNIENIKIYPDKKHFITRYLVEMFQAIQDQDLNLSSLKEEGYSELIIYSIFDYLCHHQGLAIYKPSNHERVLRRALELIHKTSNHLSLEEISKGAYASRRCMQYAFSDIINISPMKYVKLYRLNLIREEFSTKNKRSNISSLISKYSITNYGRFTQEYTALFGEKPMQTIQRKNK